MKKILIVDDQIEVRELVQVTLEIGNYQILSAENGQQAIEIARVEHPDIILMDIMMPQIDGFEVCSRLKAGELTRTIPVLMVTALDDPQARVNGMRVGAADFITKPVDARDLFARVVRLLSVNCQEVISDRSWIPAANLVNQE